MLDTWKIKTYLAYQTLEVNHQSEGIEKLHHKFVRDICQPVFETEHHSISIDRIFNLSKSASLKWMVMALPEKYNA